MLCVSGRMRAGPPGEEQELGPGDAVLFAADVAHRYRPSSPARRWTGSCTWTSRREPRRRPGGLGRHRLRRRRLRGAFAVVLAGLRGVGASPAEAASGLMALLLVMGCSDRAGRTHPAADGHRLVDPRRGAAGHRRRARRRLPDRGRAFLLCGVLLALVGLWPWLGRTIDRIPRPLAAAMLAGVLLPLCLEPFPAVESAPGLALPVIATWAVLLLLRPALGRARGLVVAVAAVVISSRWTSAPPPAWRRARRHRPRPPHRARAGAGRAAVRGHDGLAERDRDGGTGHLRLPPALAHGADLDRRRHRGRSAVRRPRGEPGGHHRRAGGRARAHPDPGRRWVAAAAGGVSYMVLGLSAAAATAFLAASPPEVLATVAGLALLTALGPALATALEGPAPRGRADHVRGQRLGGDAAERDRGGVGPGGWTGFCLRGRRSRPVSVPGRRLP